MQVFAPLFNAAFALIFGWCTLDAGMECLESFSNGHIVEGLFLLPFVALLAFLAVACGHFALHGEG